VSEFDAGHAGPTGLRLTLGARLRRYREDAGVSADEAAGAIRASRSKISRMEHGRVGFKERDVHDLLIRYGIADETTQAETLTLARQANAPRWWAGYHDIVPAWFAAFLGMEEAASVIRSFDCQSVNGLLQTRGYARALTTLRFPGLPRHEIDRRVEMWLRRQDMLQRPGAPRLWLMVDESVLRRPVGGREVMRAQLARLVEASELPTVTIQVVPFDCGEHAAVGASFSVLRFAEPEVADVVYLHHLTGALYLEKRAEVKQYVQALNLLSIHALSPQASTVFLREAHRCM
jgi:transcriptional regulator with XRE-family HTH domain